jgi:hypothetical protein
MDIKSILQKIGLGAATVGAVAGNAATGGALAPLTNSLLKLLGDKLDPTVRAQVDAAALAAQAEFQKLEWDHAEKIAAIAQADLANARAREISIRDRIPAQLAWAMTLGLFTLLGILVFRPIPVANNALLYVLLGSLATSQAAIIAYYFGSSAGSAQKTEMLGQFRAQIGKAAETGVGSAAPEKQ